jgi:hypothetical protein
MTNSLPLCPIRIYGDFPGGNILVKRMEGDIVYRRQDLRETDGWWFHWAFRVRGAAGRTLRVHFTDRDSVGTRGAQDLLFGRGWNESSHGKEGARSTRRQHGRSSSTCGGLTALA